MRIHFSRAFVALAIILMAVATGCQAAPIATPTAAMPAGGTPTQATGSASSTATTTTAGTTPTGASTTPTTGATPVTASTPTAAGTPTSAAGGTTATVAATGTATTTPASSTQSATPTAMSVTATFPVTVTDDAGRTIVIKSAPNKIVSLAPSNTEILYALGLGTRVAAVSQFDNYPDEVKSKPKISTDQLKPNIEQVVATGSDLVLAIGGDPDSIKQIADKNIPVIVLDPKNFDDILKDITLVGKATGQVQQAQTLDAQMKARIDAVVAKAKTATDHPKVFVELDASDPTKPYTVGPGSFIDSMITMAGGQNIEADAKTQYPQVSLEDVVAKDPDIIILNDAQYGITPDQVKSRPGWGNISAVKNNKIYPINSDLTSRPGPRIVEGLEQIAKIIHPDLFK